MAGEGEDEGEPPARLPGEGEDGLIVAFLQCLTTTELEDCIKTEESKLAYCVELAEKANANVRVWNCYTSMWGVFETAEPQRARSSSEKADHEGQVAAWEAHAKKLSGYARFRRAQLKVMREALSEKREKEEDEGAIICE